MQVPLTEIRVSKFIMIASSSSWRIAVTFRWSKKTHRNEPNAGGRPAVKISASQIDLMSSST